MAKKVLADFSPKYSFKGWMFSKWAAGLLEFRKWLGSMKNVLKTGVAVVAAIIVFKFQPYALAWWGEAIAALAVGFVSKFLTDSADYWLNRYSLPPA